jgi:hypothetical protein
MKKSLLEIYALAICFAAVVTIMFQGATATYQILEITWPEFFLSRWDYLQYQTDEAFLERWPDKKPPPDLKDVPRLRQERLALAIQNQRHFAVQNLINSAIYLVVGFVVFALHWVLARRERRRNQGAA